MKIYTEEQVKRAMLHSYLSGVERPADYLPIEESILNELTPIELPSDEEIEQEAYYKVSDHTENPYASFKSGAKWLREQILNQKETL